MCENGTAQILARGLDENWRFLMRFKSLWMLFISIYLDQDNIVGFFFNKSTLRHWISVVVVVLLLLVIVPGQLMIASGWYRRRMIELL